MKIEDLMKPIMVFVEENKKGLCFSVSDIASEMKLDKSAVDYCLQRLNDHAHLKYWYKTDQYSLPEIAPSISSSTPPKSNVKRKPYSISEVAGFKKGDDKVTIFLGRKNHARSITFSNEELKRILGGI